MPCHLIPPPPLSTCLLACHALLPLHLPAITLSSYIGKLVLVDAPEGPKVVRRKKSRSPTGSVGDSVKGSVRGASRSPSPTGSVGSSAARRGPRQPLKPAPVEPKRQVGTTPPFSVPPSSPACLHLRARKPAFPCLPWVPSVRRSLVHGVPLASPCTAFPAWHTSR